LKGVLRGVSVEAVGHPSLVVPLTVPSLAIIDDGEEPANQSAQKQNTTMKTSARKEDSEQIGTIEKEIVVMSRLADR
jgi:hypothetical protein